MRIKSGTQAPIVELPQLDGSIFSTASLEGRPYLLSFYRFAGCPFCNLRMHQLVQRYGELGDDFELVAVFDSPLDNLQEHTSRHDAPFPVLADAENTYYRAFGIEKSVLGVLKGMIFRFPTLMKGMAKGYVPLKIKGSMITMPADFLVRPDGVVQYAHYGQDEGDHMPFDDVVSFARAL